MSETLKISRPKKRIAFSVILTLCLLVSTPSWAKAVALEKGQPAPFAGQLLTPEDAVELVQKIEREKFEKQIEIDYLKRVHKAEMEALKPKWHEHPAFVVTVTIVSMIGVFTVTAYGLQAVSNR